jgi:hypothetical protein
MPSDSKETADYVRSGGFAFYPQPIGNLLKILNQAPHLGLASCRIGRAQDRRRVHGGDDMGCKGALDKPSTGAVDAEVSS